MTRSKCGEHGLSGDLDASGDPKCQLCRHQLGLLPIAAPEPAREDRCGKPGHEYAPRQNCPLCGSERAERYGSLERRKARAAVRVAVRRPTERKAPEPGELTHAVIVPGLDRVSVAARPVHRPVKGGLRVVDGGQS